MTRLLESVANDVEKRRHRGRPFDEKYVRLGQASFEEVSTADAAKEPIEAATLNVNVRVELWKAMAQAVEKDVEAALTKYGEEARRERKKLVRPGKRRGAAQDDGEVGTIEDFLTRFRDEGVYERYTRADFGRVAEKLRVFVEGLGPVELGGVTLDREKECFGHGHDLKAYEAFGKRSNFFGERCVGSAAFSWPAIMDVSLGEVQESSEEPAVREEMKSDGQSFSWSFFPEARQPCPEPLSNSTLKHLAEAHLEKWKMLQPRPDAAMASQVQCVVKREAGEESVTAAAAMLTRTQHEADEKEDIQSSSTDSDAKIDVLLDSEGEKKERGAASRPQKRSKQTHRKERTSILSKLLKKARKPRRQYRVRNGPRRTQPQRKETAEGSRLTSNLRRLPHCHSAAAQINKSVATGTGSTASWTTRLRLPPPVLGVRSLSRVPPPAKPRTTAMACPIVSARELLRQQNALAGENEGNRTQNGAQATVGNVNGRAEGPLNQNSQTSESKEEAEEEMMNNSLVHVPGLAYLDNVAENTNSSLVVIDADPGEAKARVSGRRRSVGSSRNRAIPDQENNVCVCHKKLHWEQHEVKTEPIDFDPKASNVSGLLAMNTTQHGLGIPAHGPIKQEAAWTNSEGLRNAQLPVQAVKPCCREQTSQPLTLKVDRGDNRETKAINPGCQTVSEISEDSQSLSDIGCNLIIRESDVDMMDSAEACPPTELIPEQSCSSWHQSVLETAFCSSRSSASKRLEPSLMDFVKGALSKRQRIGQGDELSPLRTLILQHLSQMHSKGQTLLRLTDLDARVTSSQGFQQTSIKRTFLVLLLLAQEVNNAAFLTEGSPFHFKLQIINDNDEGIVLKME